MAPCMRRPFFAALLGLAMAALGLAGCSNDAPSTGVTQIDQAVVVAYKPCRGNDAAIEQLALYGSDDRDVAIWEAQRQFDGVAVLDMPVRERYPGYDIIDRRAGETLDPRQRYTFEATATDGTEWAGPGFSPDALVQGKVQIDGEELAFRDWVDSPTTCSSVGLPDPRYFLFLAVVAVVIGVAGLMGLLLIAIKVIIRRDRRQHPDATGPLRS